MSWLFKKVIQGVGQAAGFLASNSGSIGKVASVIAGIAGKSLTEEMLAAEGGNLLPILGENLKEASDFIVAEAANIFDSDKPLAEGVQKLGPYELTGIWDSLDATQSKHCSPAVIQDIHAFLSLNRIPNTIKDKNTVYDIGERIGYYMTLPDNQTIRKRNGQIYYSVPIKFKAGQTFFDGGAVYYKIPLGNENTRAAWHTVIRIWTIGNKSAHEENSLYKQSNAMVPSKDPIGKQYNSTTISVSFTGARNTLEVMSQVYANLQKSPQMTITEQPFYNGTKYIYQVATPTNVGSNTVEEILAGTISDVLGAPADNSVPRFPVIQVESQQTYTTPPQFA